LNAACAAVGRLYLRQGHVEKSIAILERGLDVCRVTNISLLVPVTASSLGAAYTLAGRVNDGLLLLEEAVRRAKAMHRMVDQALWLAWFSEALLRAGQCDRAHDLAQRALETASRYQERGNRAWVLKLLADIHSVRDADDIGRAAGHCRDALAEADRLGMRPLEAHCHLGLAVLNGRTGRADDAQRFLRRASELFRDMDMTLWISTADAARARLEESTEPDTRA
jgi:tetratricopeptide (TPR) repeat protein